MQVADTSPIVDELDQRFRAAFDNAPIGMALVGLDGSWIDANPAVLRLLGYDLATLQTMTFQDVTHPDDLEPDLGLLDRLLRGDIDRYHMDKRYIRRDGRTVWASLSVAVVRDDTGGPRYFVSQIVDVSEAKRTERTLLDYAGRLARSNEELQEFASVAAHDLAQPLRAIEHSLGFLRADLDDRLTTAERDDLDRIVAAASELQLLVSDLLTYARATDTRVAMEAVRLDDVAAAAVAALAGTIVETGADLHIGPLPQVRGNHRQLVQLFQNLIGNATKFARPGTTPTVTVSAVADGGDWRIEVADHGIGIAPEDRERVFRMFTRTDTAADREGSGIGLAICKKVVETHEGRIWIEPSPVGTRVCVTLPGV